MDSVNKRLNINVSSWQNDWELRTIRNTGVDEAAADTNKAGGVDEGIEGSNPRRRLLHLLSTIRAIYRVISKQFFLFLEVMELNCFEYHFFAVSQFCRRDPPIDGERGAIRSGYTPIPLIRLPEIDDFANTGDTFHLLMPLF